MVKGVGEGLRIHPSGGLTGVNEQLFLKKPEVMAGAGWFVFAGLTTETSSGKHMGCAPLQVFLPLALHRHKYAQQFTLVSIQLIDVCKGQPLTV